MFLAYAILLLLITVTDCIGGLMGTEHTTEKAGVKVKRKGHPIGKVGVHVKGGIKVTRTAFFGENRWASMPRIGEGSIRP